MTYTNIDNESVILHDNNVRINGYDVIFYDNSHWLKIFHHNSRYGYFTDDNANYSTNKNLFSILSKIDDKFRISNGTANVYSLMLELPQIPQHIRWHQYSYFTDTSNTSIGYEQLSDTNGTWLGFGGIHVLTSKYSYTSLYVGQNNGYNWDFPIGCKVNSYHGYIPCYPIAVQFMDLWIELKDLTTMNLLDPILSICTEKIKYQHYIPYSYLFVFVLLYE